MKTKAKKSYRLTRPLWEFLSRETQQALIHAGLVDPGNIEAREGRSGVRLILLGETTEELERIMKKRPEGAYAAYISGGPLRPDNG